MGGDRHVDGSQGKVRRSSNIASPEALEVHQGLHRRQRRVVRITEALAEKRGGWKVGDTRLIRSKSSMPDPSLAESHVSATLVHGLEILFRAYQRLPPPIPAATKSQ